MRQATLLALALTALPAAAQPITDFEAYYPERSPVVGTWVGAMLRGASVLPIQIDIAPDGDSLRAAITQPIVGYFGRPARSVRYDPPRLYLDFWGGAEFVVDTRFDELRGTRESWDETPITLHLHRHPPPGIPGVLEEAVEVAGELPGSLLLPPGPGPHPAVVFIHGRGYGSRYGQHGLARMLAGRGIAALVFDGRGADGVLDFTAEDRIRDAMAAFDLVAQHPAIDPSRVGYYGGSAGAWIVPEAAVRDGRAAFVVTSVGPAVSMPEQQGHVIEYLMRWDEETTFAEEEIEAARVYQVELAAMAAAGAPWEALAAHVAAADGQRWADFVDRPPSEDDSEIDFFRREPYDHTAALRRLTVPVLALFGERDYVVPPHENIPVLERLLAEAGNDDVTIVVFPDAEHSMLLGEGGWRGSPDGQGSWPETFYAWTRRAPGYYTTIADWLVAQLPDVDE